MGGGIKLCNYFFIPLHGKIQEIYIIDRIFFFLICPIVLNMKKVKQVREPYNPPQWELFEFQVGLSVLADFSVEEIEDFEIGPDLTPREDIRYDIL